MVKVHINGTHTAPLRLPPLEIQFLPPTGKRVQVTDELVTFTVKNGKVTWIEAVRVEGGLLAQLDITLAAHP